MKKLPVTFETITPLFTGDCNQEMTEIKPTSIMGSLRFWFEVICHFSGKFNNEAYSKNELNAKEFKGFIKEKPDTTSEEIQKEFKLSPTAFYFGCTGWKSRIGIEKIHASEESNLGNFLSNPEVIYFDKYMTNPIWKECSLKDYKRKDKREKQKLSSWFLPNQYFCGKFEITFSLPDKSLKENILFPVLSFIQEYGFLGGKNNLGYGRVKILNPSFTNKEMIILRKKIDYTALIRSKQLKESEMVNYSSDKMEVLWLEEKKENKQNQRQYSQTDNTICAEIEEFEVKHFGQIIPYIDNIKCLLLLKSKMRKNISDRFQRHYFFGSSSEKKEFFFYWNGKKYEKIHYPNATKIIPLIRENKRGFLAIPGIIEMEETINEKQ